MSILPLPPPDNASETEKKMYKILVLLVEIPFNLLINKFFDADSEKNLDKKIEVLEKIKNGEEYSEKEFYEILELYPDGGGIWD